MFSASFFRCWFHFLLWVLTTLLKVTNGLLRDILALKGLMIYDYFHVTSRNSIKHLPNHWCQVIACQTPVLSYFILSYLIISYPMCASLTSHKLKVIHCILDHTKDILLIIFFSEKKCLWPVLGWHMMKPCHENVFHISGLFHHWWIPLSQKASNIELCFLFCWSEPAVAQLLVCPVIWDVMTLMWCHCNHPSTCFVDSPHKQPVMWICISSKFIIMTQLHARMKLNMISCPVVINLRLTSQGTLGNWQRKNWGCLTSQMPRLGYFKSTRSKPWLLMPWLLVSPGHQEPWCWLCGINRSLSSVRKDFNYL